MTKVTKINISEPPYPDRAKEAAAGFPWHPAEVWPCKWIHASKPSAEPRVTAFRLSFRLEEPSVFRCHVSADERYELILDGVWVGRGSERGSRIRWYYDTYEMDLEPGEHWLVAKTWALGELAPWAQLSVNPGFLLSPEAPELIELIGTGCAKWQYMDITAYRFGEWADCELGSGPMTVLHGELYPWGMEGGAGEGWQPAAVGKAGNNGEYLHLHAPVHRLFPSPLPSMAGGPIRSWTVAAVAEAPPTWEEPVFYPPGSGTRSETFVPWEEWRDGRPVTIPPASRFAVLLDLNQYYCGYTRLLVSGGAGGRVQVSWSEALYGDCVPVKGDRRLVEGKTFRGYGDIWLPDGGEGRCFGTLWWTGGRYVQLRIETGPEELTLHALELEETRYPLQVQGSYDCDHVSYREFIPTAVRSLQMCLHETYMDCPYWEQLMYAGDTRLQILLTYILSEDPRPARKALVLFHDSCMNPSLLPASSYPDRNAKLIPSFCMWWISMLHDYSLWRGDVDLIRSLLPMARQTMDRLLLYRNGSGLATVPEGWNYIDAAEPWTYGVPPEGEDGVHAVYNWQLVYTLVQLAELEKAVGEPELGQRSLRLAQELHSRLDERFWNEESGLYADDIAHQCFSEHTQSLAVLSGLLPAERESRIKGGLQTGPDLTSTSIYYSHYLFEAYARLDLTSLLLKRLEPWWGLKALGLYTTPESFGETRSDCHAWGAHPLYHLAVSIAGIRPGSMGFGSVLLEPRLGGLGFVSATMPHPAGGLIRVEYHADGEGLTVEVELPLHVEGELRYLGKRYPIPSGASRFDIRSTQ